MATSRKSADYDPIEEALDVGFGVGREHERERSKERERAAGKSGRRKAQATERKRQAAERSERHAKRQAQDRSRKAAREVEVARARRGAFAAGQASRRPAAREEELAAARRGAYRSAMADAKREAAALGSKPRTGAGVTGSGASSGFSAPTFRPGITTTSGRLDKTTTSRIIVVCIGLSFAGVIYRDTMRTPPGKTAVTLDNGEKLVVPTHLRSFAGVFIAGTICLVINEFSPELALVLALAFLFDVGASALGGKTGLLEGLGKGLTARGGSVAQPYTKPKVQPSTGKSGLAPGAGAGGGAGGGGGGSWP